MSSWWRSWLWSWFQCKKTTRIITLRDLTELLETHNRIVVLSGAGASVESGVPTFRDPSDGLWVRHDLMRCGTSWGFKRSPEALWAVIKELAEELNPQPNPGHRAIAELERKGKLISVITQNIDGLHQAAGSEHVTEFHGTIYHASCFACHEGHSVDKAWLRNLQFLPPECHECGGVMKPSVVLFGDGIPTSAILDASDAVKSCDLLLVIGTSANVSPANHLPWNASYHGAQVVEINLEPTGLTNEVSDFFYQGPASKLMEAVEALS